MTGNYFSLGFDIWLDKIIHEPCIYPLHANNICGHLNCLKQPFMLVICIFVDATGHRQMVWKIFDKVKKKRGGNVDYL